MLIWSSRRAYALIMVNSGTLQEPGVKLAHLVMRVGRTVRAFPGAPR